MHRIRVVGIAYIFICGVTCIFVFVQMVSVHAFVQASASTQITQSQPVHASRSLHPSSSVPPAPNDIQLDPRLPVQTLTANRKFTNINAKFGSRFDFSVQPGASSVASGTDGLFHENKASYIVGLAPEGQRHTFIFHMGTASSAQSDSYVLNEQWMQGFDTTRWEGDATDGEGMHIIVDIIDTFQGEPGCTTLVACANGVKDDIVPVLIIGISLQNFSPHPLAGKFLFGSNRKLPSEHACVAHTTPAGTPVNILSYDPSADATGGTLFLAGDQQHWGCNTDVRNRAGLAWYYSIPATHTNTSYLILGGWNASQSLFANTTLSAGCQNEGLYASTEWSSLSDVVDFAIDNLSVRENLLGRAQTMENYLISNDVLTPAQRWLIGTTLRSYKASSWLTDRQDCAGGGYDAAVYEGTYGFLSTVDVMHEYGYFEITRIPWFFKAEMSAVFQNATHNAFGTYFQHDQGGDVDKNGNCTAPGRGIPTLRSTCYIPPYTAEGIPMPTEENDNVALLMAYYTYVTGDKNFLVQYIGEIDAAMDHNLRVGNPNTGIAYNAQDTNTTYDAADDCLHNNIKGAGNQYYQGLKEATGYRASAYLDSLLPGDMNGATWSQAASKIEGAMVQEYNRHGYLPIADNVAFTNCNGRTITLGEGLFYLHLIGQDAAMNQTLLQDLATQYPDDLRADTLPSLSSSGHLLSSSSSPLIVMTSTAARGAQCSTSHCHRYEWFSKVMLSGIVADLVYTKYGCGSCVRLNEAQAAYRYNNTLSDNFVDGFHDDYSDWGGHFYPRGIISWAYLSPLY